MGRAAESNDSDSELVAPDASALARRLGDVRELVFRREYVDARRSLEALAPYLMDSVGRPLDGAVSLVVEHQLCFATVVCEVDGDIDRALSIVGGAADLVRAEHIDHLRARAIAQEAFVLQRAGRDVDALEILADADAALDRAPPMDAAQILLNRGILRLDHGSLADAMADFREAERVASAAGFARRTRWARHNQGWVAYLEGDLPRALALMDHDGRIVGASKRGERVSAINAMDMAQVLTEAGLLDEAAHLLDDAIDDLAVAQRAQDEGEARLARARLALLNGELDVARSQAASAAECFEARRNRRWLRRAEMARLAALVEQAQLMYDQEGQAPELAAELRVQIAEFLESAEVDDDEQLVLSTHLMAAEASLVADDVEAAGRHATAVDLDHARSISLRMRWHRVQAELAHRRGGDVGTVVATAMGELARRQAELGSLDLRTAMAIHGREVAEIGVSSALTSGDAASIHFAIEQSRASSTRLAPVRVELDDDEQVLLSSLRRATAGEGLGGVARDLTAHDVADEARNRLRARAWHRRGGAARAELVGLAAASDVLGQHGAIAATWVRQGHRLLAATVDADGLEVVDAGRIDAVLAAVERIRSDLSALLLGGVPELVRATMRSSLARDLARVDELLLGAVEAGSRSLVAVPSGALSLVPWPLLPSRSGHATTVAPCLTAWVGAVAKSRTGSGVAAVAGPRLQRAVPEVAAVANQWPRAATWTGDLATTSLVRQVLRTADVVHLAVHGRHRASSPLFSSLELADGPLVAHEVVDDVAARLVVLSACEVGTAQVRHGDEPLGLTAALQHAGAGTVLAGLTPVRDVDAHDVMVEVHRQLAAGHPPAHALGVAVAAAAADGVPVAFTCAGAGLVALGDDGEMDRST